MELLKITQEKKSIMTKDEFIIELHKTGAIKFGSFVLKSGITSPFYINLRQIISYPRLMESLAGLIKAELPAGLGGCRIAGVPYSGIPIASALSLATGLPMIIQRKEEKAYGSKDAVIGIFEKGDPCLLIEDIITSGESILEASRALAESGLNVQSVFVVIDRRVIRGNFFEKHGIHLYSLLTMEHVVEVLAKTGLLDSEHAAQILTFLNTPLPPASKYNDPEYSNPLTEKLVNAMRRKRTNVVLSLDVENSDSFFHILESVADDIVMVKTHIDILKDFSPGFLSRARELCAEKDIILFEDRKFADIGNTVKMQYRSGVYKISDWAEFITVHCIAGESILKGLFEGLENRSSFLLAKMSAKNNLISEDYTRKVLEIGRKNASVVSGFIGHGSTGTEIELLKKKVPEGFLLLMPGVQFTEKGDTLGQTYIPPDIAVRGGADCIIVGRGITHAANPQEAAGRYREVGWTEYIKRTL